MFSICPLSRVWIIFLIAFCWANQTSAQENFGVREMVRYSDVPSGYQTYHDTMRVSDDGVSDRYAPEPRLQVDEDDGQAERIDRNVRQVPQVERNEVTRLEDFYRARSHENKLNQYGYNLFYHIDKNIKNEIYSDRKISPSGLVGDDYILQIGDEISIIWSGELKGREVYTVGTDGRLIMDKFPPMRATGKTLGALKIEIDDLKKSIGYRGDVNLSVNAMRQIGVLVAGHVMRPGHLDVNVSHSVIDVLNMVGGVRKSGSLRQIKLVRQGRAFEIDLYGYIANGVLPRELQLVDGDRIIVPSIGPTIAIVGDVKQPGIFELKPDPRLVWRDPSANHAAQINLQDAIDLAGGVLSAGDNQFTLLNSSSNIINLNNIKHDVIGDGSIITVTRADDVVANGVTLAGYSRKNGVYALNDVPTLQKLLRDQYVFGDDIYPLMGVVSRIERQNLTRHMMGFSPQAVARAEDDRQLEAGDIVYLFSHDDIAEIKGEDNDQSINKSADDSYPKLVRDFVRDNHVTVQGAVRDAGEWPVGGLADVKTLISVAGGLTRNADKNHLEIVSVSYGHEQSRSQSTFADNAILSPGDQLRVNETFKKALNASVKMTGEVRNPGTYDLMRGDTLLSLIDRAGGLTAQAYPPATVFSRASERKREEHKFHAAAQELERTVSVNMNATDKDATLTPAQISMAKDLAEELRAVQAIGRITVEADPTILASRPELNMLLEDGDRIHIPKRNLTVRVTGEVMNSASLLFEDGKDPEDYIREAGGMTYYADSGRVFVLYPDGTSQPLRGSSWRTSKPAAVIPGSTIIVPRDPKPFSFVDSFKDITQILTNMAITTVFIDDVVSE